MFLKKLIIAEDDNVIREIPFFKGLNLIVDETKTDNKKESGNNVGKSTVLRLIYFCLGDDGENIYQDPEFKHKFNTDIKNYLLNNNIIITLILKKSLDDENSQELTIRRNFLKRKKKILEINGKSVKANNFAEKLKEIIFKTNVSKPTFLDIISKNIRNDSNRINKTIKVLNQFATQEQYEAVYLFWLGIALDTNERKQELLRERKFEESLFDRLKRQGSLSQIEQSLFLINRKIDEFSERKNNLNLNEQYEEDLEELNNTKTSLNSKSTIISNLQMRKDLIIESKAQLENEKSFVDAQLISSLYKEAKLLIPNLQKSFDDTVIFHNTMIQKKLEYITKEFTLLDIELNELKRDVSILLVKERDLSLKLKKSDVEKDLQDIIIELNRAYEKKGSLEEQKILWDKVTKNLEKIDIELQDINDSILNKDAIIQKRIALLNVYFSKISLRLYGEEYILSSDNNKNGYELNIGSMEGNPGTGKKKGQMAAFDLAYIQFAEELGIECLHFILQDQIENVHDNQISSILIDIVSSINCQYIIPVLRDKLPLNIDVEQYSRVSLSQSDKLFKL